MESQFYTAKSVVFLFTASRCAAKGFRASQKIIKIFFEKVGIPAFLIRVVSEGEISCPPFVVSEGGARW
jgi:hypothetical protein